MAKFEIETYKGQLIEYDDEYDKFLCDITIEDKWKSTKRASLKDVRKEIDTFIKLNAEFKPFKVILLDNYDQKSFEIMQVTAIRSDGKFVVKNEAGNSTSYYGVKEMRYARIYEQDIVDKSEELEEQFEAATKLYRAGIIELCKKTKPIDLAKYSPFINQQNKEQQ